MGADFLMRVTRDTGRPADEVVRAWITAARLADHGAVVEEMAAQSAPVPTNVEHLWLLRLVRVLERTARWVLRNVPTDEPTARVIDDYIVGLGALRPHFSVLVTGDDKKLYEARVAEIKELGADDALAKDLITLRFLDQLLDVLRVARETGGDPVEAARVFYRVSRLLHVPRSRAPSSTARRTTAGSSARPRLLPTTSIARTTDWSLR